MKTIKASASPMYHFEELCPFAERARCFKRCRGLRQLQRPCVLLAIEELPRTVEATIDYTTPGGRVRDLNTGQFLPGELARFADDHGLINVKIKP